MALELRLDGKAIGSVNDKGQIDRVDDTPKRETMKIDLGPDPRQAQEDEDKPKVEEPEDDEAESEEKSEDEETEDARGSRDPELLAIKSQLGAITQMMTSLQERRTKVEEPDLVKDHIPDGIDKERDPFGLAITMKGVVKAINDIGKRVTKLDQHTGFTEGMRQIEGEKGKHPIFSDKKIGPLADKLLEAELRTSNDPLPIMVQRVADQLSPFSPAIEKALLRKKAEITSKVPKTLRKSDGSSPAIVVNKPRSVKEAGEAYQQWRASRNKAYGGR